MSNAELILGGLPCSVELPAGTGKTETIGELVRLLADDRKRALVLTHTHAGVDVIRRRMRKFGVPRDAVTVRTLDSWCFDLIASFPDLSGLQVGDEPDWTLTRSYHEAGRRAVLTPPVLRMLAASYDLLIVDEYQDCQLWQHELVAQMSATVPTCVLGDRMQGLFFFGSAQPVDWVLDVQSRFPPVEISIVPWRWRSTHPLLGEWLLEARHSLLNGAPIDLLSAPLSLISSGGLRDALFTLPPHPSSTVAITKWPKDAAVLASQLGGAFTMIEELEGKFLRAFAEIIDEADPPTIAAAAIDYVVGCGFGVASQLDISLRRGLRAGTPIPLSRAGDLAPAVRDLNGLLMTASPVTVKKALEAFGRVNGYKLFRREAWYGMLDALRLCETTEGLTALDAVVSIRNKMRMTGRRPESRIIGRPLLVKGLEYQHAVVVDTDRLDAHELYVCLSRGSTSLTVVSSQTQLNPERPTRAPLVLP